MKSPMLIGIAGGTGSGKSTFPHRLRDGESGRFYEKARGGGDCVAINTLRERR